MSNDGVSHGPVGVVGAGVMGRGVSLALIAGGVPVRLVDVDMGVLDAATAEIHRFARLYPLVDVRFGPVPGEQIDALLTCSADLESLAGAEFVIENVTENWDVKKPVHEALDRICGPDVVFGVNTSAIPIDRFAAVTHRPGRVVGMHFMNPAPLKPVVEIVQARRTSERTIEAVQTLLAIMGKRGIVVRDAPGFVTNRVMMLTVNEAVRVLEEGAASPADVDQLFRECFGHRMGPLETCDLIGLDTVKLSLDVLLQEFADDRFRPAALLTKYVEAGRLGRKTGRGFFDYGQASGKPRIGT